MQSWEDSLQSLERALNIVLAMEYTTESKQSCNHSEITEGMSINEESKILLSRMMCLDLWKHDVKTCRTGSPTSQERYAGISVLLMENIDKSMNQDSSTVLPTAHKLTKACKNMSRFSWEPQPIVSLRQYCILSLNLYTHTDLYSLYLGFRLAEKK